MKNNFNNSTGKPNDIEVIDVPKYQPQKVPSLTWCDCIKKIWTDDSLICAECLSEMKIISFITEDNITKKILMYLDMWDEKRGSQLRADSARDPPVTPDFPNEILYVPVDDGWG